MVRFVSRILLIISSFLIGSELWEMVHGFGIGKRLMELSLFFRKDRKQYVMLHKALMLSARKCSVSSVHKALEWSFEI